MLKRNDKLIFGLFDTCLGWMGVVGSPNGLKKVFLPQKSKELVLNQIISFGCVAENHNLTYFSDLPDRLRRYLEGEPAVFANKLDLDGTTRFQQGVWHIVRTIPYGGMRNYAWVASELGLPGAARAVGQALARNPLPIVIPCHRVIASGGGLGGFSGGIEIKKYLLCLERAPSIKLFG